jgi:hypothetical protein
MSSRSLALACCASLLAGCLPGLQLEAIKTGAGKPSNVAVYFSVARQDGTPVSGLTADQFTVFEDGTRVGSDETRQTLVSPKVAMARYALFLVDMSGTVLAPKDVGDVIKSAASFTERLDGAETVGVYAFDGSPDLSQVVPFATDAVAAEVAAEKVEKAKPKEGKGDLDTAIILGLKALKKALAADPRPSKVGSLVVITDGTGHAGTGGGAALRAALVSPDYAKIDVFAVGIGDQVDKLKLAVVGKSGTVTELDPANLASAFDKAAAKVEAAAGHYYLLSYCTPKRGGLHTMRIEAHGPDNLLGDVSYAFNADGFGDGCDPTSPPGFDAPPPPPPVEKKEAKKETPRKPAHKPHPAAAPPAGGGATPPPPPPASDPFAP